MSCHAKPFLRVGIIAMMSFAAHLNGIAQNLVPNPNFEVYTNCPFGGDDINEATPWIHPTPAPGALFNVCAVSPQADVPTHTLGHQYPLNGDGYAGVLARAVTPETREYIMAPLTAPLEEGRCYLVGFYVNLSNYSCPVDKIGAYLSANPTNSASSEDLPYEPVIRNTGYINDTVTWMEISGHYLAAGGEQFITIGNFYDDAETPFHPDCDTPPFYALIYIDSVFVIDQGEVQELAINLDETITACYEYEIDPGLPDAMFQWENGSASPTLTVTESGVYSVTASEGCAIGEDSIAVIILGSDPVVINPSTVTFCEGESYTLTLDDTQGTYTWNDGTVSNEYEFTTPGLYTVILDDGCDLTTDNILIDVTIPPAAVNLGADTFYCEGSALVLSVDPAAGDIEWQNGSQEPDQIITTPGAYAVTVSNACGEVSDVIQVSAVPVPNVELGAPMEAICQGELLTYNFDPAIGHYLWQDASTNAIYTISTAGTYSVTLSNGCGTDQDAIIVETITAPQVQLGPPVSICHDDTLTLNVTQPYTSYVWSDGTTDPEYTITDPGQYAVTATNTCGTKADTITVAIVPALAVPELGPDAMLCPGESYTLYVNVPNADYAWQDMSTADSFVVSAAGIYFVQASNQCYTTYDTLLVMVSADPPDLALPATDTICEGATLVVSSGIAGVMYAWSDGTHGSTATVQQPGEVSLTVTNACGTDSDTISIISGGFAPAVDLIDAVALCPGEQVTLTPDHEHVISWLWQDGSTDSTFTVTASGAISVQVTNACGVATDSVAITALQVVPPFSIGSDTAICEGAMLTLTVAIPDVSLQWSTGDSIASLVVSEPDQYIATATNACGSQSDTITISGLPAIPLLYLGADQSLCPGEEIIVEPNIDDVLYMWQDGSTDSTLSVTAAATVVLTITNACGTSTDTLEIIESTDGPQLHLGPDIVACKDDTITIAAGISGVDYMWQDGSTEPEITTTVSGDLILTVSNNCGTDTDTLHVSLSRLPPVSDLGDDIVLCDDKTAQLSTLHEAGTSFVWSTGDHDKVIVIDAPGEYWLERTNSCGTHRDTVAVTQAFSPEPFYLGPDTVICPGTSFLITAPAAATDLVTWQDGSHDLQMEVSETILYSLEIENGCGKAYDDMWVAISRDEPKLALEQRQYLCFQDTLVLDATQPFPVNYAWSTGETSASIALTEPGTYSIRLEHNCFTLEQTVDVVYDADCEFPSAFYIPTIFSPNGDGNNDLLELHANSFTTILSITGGVYDRWGKMVYQPSGTQFSWDGTSGHRTVNPGVFAYNLIIFYLEGTTKKAIIKQGDVTVVR